jgi:hypothetical protein
VISTHQIEGRSENVPDRCVTAEDGGTSLAQRNEKELPMVGMRTGYSPLFLQLGLPPMLIQDQAAALPPFALFPIHAAALNALGGGMPMLGNSPIPAALLMPNPMMMFPLMQAITGAGYAPNNGRQSAPGEEQVDLRDLGWASNRKEAKRMERALKNNPRARAAFEAAVGGRIVDWGGRNDGRLTIERFPQGVAPTGPQSLVAVNPSAALIAGMLSGMSQANASSLAQMGGPQQFGGGGPGAMNPFLMMAMLAFMGLLGQLMGGGMGGGFPGGGFPGLPGFPGGFPNPFGAGTGSIGGTLGMPPFSFDMLSGAGAGSWNPLAAPGHINNTNPGYEAAHQQQVAAVLNDPSLSVEDKVMLMLALIMKKMDDDIEKQMQYINALQQQQANRNKAGGAKGKGGSSPSVDVEMQKLQRMITKRAQLFEMASNIMKKYDDTARAAIQKINQ